MKQLNWRVLFVIGLIAGLVQVLAGIVMYVAGVYFAAWSMLASLLVLLFCIVLGTIWYRNRMLEGAMTFGQALVLGIVISVSTGLIYALYNIISISFFYPHFLDDMIRNGVVRIQASGLSSDQSSELIASMKRNATVPIIALGNFIRLSIIGGIFSLITSIILRRKNSAKVSN